MAYTVVSWICIAAMIGIVAYFAAQFFARSRAEKIEFIKEFKKGQCAIIYLVAIPIFLMAQLYSGETIANSIFNAISKAVYLVVLKYDVSTALIDANVVYAAASYLCFSLVIVNAVMITVSILHRHIWNAYRLFRFRILRGDGCIVLGNNAKSRLIYRSCTCRKVIADVLPKNVQEQLYIAGISYRSCMSANRLAAWLDKCILRTARRTHDLDTGGSGRLNLIVNFEDEQSNLAWCGRFVELINRLDKRVVMAVDVYVFGDREFEDIYSKYEAASRGCLHYVNEYQQIALDFIDRYPLPLFMDERHIDYETSLLREEAQFNVVMIGFGRTNQQIFLSMVANDQFITQDSAGHIAEKQVQYHLFDKCHTGDHKNLNHNYFRYRYGFYDKNGLRVNSDDYLPLPALPSAERYHSLDINDEKFYEDLRGVISAKAGAVNFIVVSLGMDYASIDIANKIAAKVAEWELGNTHIFVRIREESISRDATIFFDTGLCHPFGTEKGVVYDYAHIIQEKFTEMAIMRNFVYDIERDMKHDHITKEERISSRLRWYVSRSSIERESNVYACLALRSKLLLMGLDCRREQDAGEALSEEAYFSIYAKGDMPEIVMGETGHVQAVRYPLEEKNSRRRTMAMQEHLRWNAYMIMKGFIPADKKRILTEKDAEGKYTNGKNYTMRRHGNLTTFDGLVQFRKMIAARDGCSEAACDVIKYDYQLLDGAWWLLKNNGYKIVRRDGGENNG